MAWPILCILSYVSSNVLLAYLDLAFAEFQRERKTRAYFNAGVYIIVVLQLTMVFYNI